MTPTTKNILMSGGALAALAMICAQPAYAADEDKATGEIIVTAQKTASVASKVPQALSVFSGDMLKEKGVTNVVNLAAVTPGLEIGSASHGVSVSVRGVTTTDVTSKGEQDIVFSTDGIPVGRPQLMGLAFFDLERVEVLRGPQGTLYGKSSTGGAINVITAKPTHKLAASASVELGNYNTRRFDAMVNVPVNDSLALRAAITANSRDGFIKPALGTNTFAGDTRQAAMGGEGNWAVRVTGKYDFAADASLTLTGTAGHVGGVDGSNTVIYSRATTASGDDRFKVYYNPFAGAQGPNDNFAGVNGELAFNLGPVRVTYNGSHVWWHGEDRDSPSVYDPSNSGAYSWTAYASHMTTDSHELRLSNANPGSALEYVLGANYFHEYNDETDLNWQTLATTACLANPLTTGCNNPNPHIVGPNIHTSKGAFGQINYHATDKLKVTVGGRYSTDKMARYALLSAGPTPAGGWTTASGAPCAPPAPCVSVAQSNPDTGVNSTSAFTWRLGADYQFTPRLMAYASVSTGYKGGGFNDIDPTASTKQTGTYGAERVTAYELGFKGRVSDKLTYTTAAYYYDYSKYQITGATFLAKPDIGAVGVVIYTTLAPATMYGWENELTWKPTKDDTFNLSVSLEKAKFNGGPGAAQVGFVFKNQINWGGRSLDRVPGISGTVAYDHKFVLASGGTIKAGFNTKFSDGYWLSDLGGTGNPFAGTYTSLPMQYRQKAYTRTDLTLGYSDESGKFSIDAFVRNLEDKVQMQNTPTTPQPGWNSDGQFVRVNLPRTYGVRTTVKF